MIEDNLFRNLFSRIQESAEKARDGTSSYKDADGVLRCEKCHEPIQGEYPPDVQEAIGLKTYYRSCKCMRGKKSADEKRAACEQAKMRIEQLRSEGLYSEAYRQNTFDKDDRRNERVAKIVRKYAANFPEYAKENVGIMFWGGVGTGKSFYAACIANALIEKYYTVVMATVQDLVADMTENYGASRDYVLDTVANADLLILDDLGVERGTEFMQEHVYDIVNTRCNAKKPLIVTTNLNPDDMGSEKIDIKRRTYDRIISCCTPILISGESRRPEISEKKMQLFKKLLSEDDNVD